MTTSFTMINRQQHIRRLNSTKLTLVCLILVLQLSSLIGFTEAIDVCHICGDEGNKALEHPNVILDGVGQTCTQISLDVALNVPYDSDECEDAQKDWGDECCSGKRPDGRDPPSGLPPQDIPIVRYLGPHPICELCRDGDYPYIESMVLNFLYIGSSSCAQYYKYGREGRIEPHMCDPVKFFSYEPCGCGRFNPYFNPNHPANSGGEAPEPNKPSEGEDEDEGKRARLVPDPDGKDDSKMAGGRGGNGGMRHRHRGLKRAKMANHSIQ